MVDQELNEFEKPDPLEGAIGDLEPQPLAVSAGSVMFESGKAVGRQEALAELRRSANRSLAVWRLATAASLALALFSLVGAFNFPETSKDNSVVDRPVPVEPNNELASDNAPNKQRAQNDLPDVTQLAKHKRNLPTNERTIIGLRNRLTSPVFESDFDRPRPSASYINTQPQTAFELMQQYTASGAL